MAQLLPNGRQQFLDANGNPLAGGLVYFYIPNTTTPKDTWQDAAKSALNTNPVVCDARGQATIYGDGDYRQILQDAQKNQIWDKDVSAPVPPYVFDQGSEPKTDQGDIWINGIGACRWNSTDSKYYRIPYQTKEVITSSGSWVVPAYVNTLRLSGSAGGCAGIDGAVNIATGVGGGAGQVVLEILKSVTASDSLSIVIGAGGASSGATGGSTSVTNSTKSELLMQLIGGVTYSKGSDPSKGGSYSDWGGPGQSSAFGIGGVAGNSSRNGGNAIGNGAGGGGGGASSTVVTSGGSGAAGIVIIEF